MKRFVFMLLILLPLTLTACAGKTVLSFDNQTECGTASIILTNLQTGNISEHSVAQGKEIEIELDPETEYSYEVEYPRQPDFMQCDTKTVVVALDDGQTLNVRLESELDQELIEATATAEAASSD